MSNNRNRNRRPQQSVQQGTSQGPQDKPFTYNGKNGLITIPSGTVFDPDADVFADMSEAQGSGDELLASASMVRMIRSGFPAEVSAGINLKMSELQDFTERYMRFTGTNIPK